MRDYRQYLCLYPNFWELVALGMNMRTGMAIEVGARPGLDKGPHCALFKPI